jgi:hypothetical protein
MRPQLYSSQNLRGRTRRTALSDRQFPHPRKPRAAMTVSAPSSRPSFISTLIRDEHCPMHLLSYRLPGIGVQQQGLVMRMLKIESIRE